MQLLSPYYLSQNSAPIGYSQQVQQQQFPFQMDTQTDSNTFQEQFLKHLAFKQAQLQSFQVNNLKNIF